MAIIDITTKEFVDELGDNDSIFINYQGTLRQIKKTDLHDNTKLDKNQGSENAEKILTVDNEGNITPSDMPFIPDEVLIDKTLTIEGQAADAKKVGDKLEKKADSSSIPIELPNPHKIIFTGSVSEEYDGSSEKTINIPEAVNVGNTNITFTEPQQKENINTGESVSTLFGKIKKWLSSLKTVAFTGKYSDLSETPATMTGATSTEAGVSGFVPAPDAGKQSAFLRGDGTWADFSDTTYSVMSGATASEAGNAGLVPEQPIGSQDKYLKGDGTWNDPTSKIYENKLVTLDEINLVTEPGFFVDALAVKEGFDQLNGNISWKEIPVSITCTVAGQDYKNTYSQLIGTREVYICNDDGSRNLHFYNFGNQAQASDTKVFSGLNTVLGYDHVEYGVINFATGEVTLRQYRDTQSPISTFTHIYYR